MKNNKLAKQILDMKSQAEEAAAEAQEIRGRMAQIESNWREEFQVEDLAEADSLKTQLIEQRDQLAEYVKNRVEEIKNQYGF